jgi:hypothetical protein
MHDNRSVETDLELERTLALTLAVSHIRMYSSCTATDYCGGLFADRMWRHLVCANQKTAPKANTQLLEPHSEELIKDLPKIFILSNDIPIIRPSVNL